MTEYATSGGGRFVRIAALLAMVGAVCSPPALAEGAFTPRSATRAQSIATLSGGGPFPVQCLTPFVLSLRQDPAGGTLAARRALSSLQSESALSGERRFADREGTVVRYSTERGVFDRVDSLDGDADGMPDAVEAVLEGIAAARQLFVAQMGLPSPAPADVLLAKLGGGLDGYLIPSARKDGRSLWVLEAAPRGGLAAIRTAAAHQYAHAAVLAAGPAAPVAFGEAIATWANLKIAGGPDAQTASLLGERLERLSAGLATDDLSLAAGNALWLAFLDEAYGPSAVALTIEELSTGAPFASALDRALRRVAGETLQNAFREFHLWSVLTGARSDGRHFSFAGRLPSPAFAASPEALPALSVQGDPPVASLGAAHVLLRPEETSGGMTVRFEGETSARWDVDLLLYDAPGRIRRLPIGLSGEGRGEVTVPLRGMTEAVLLVRNLDGDGRSSRRYTWSAHRESGFPCEFASLEVRDVESPVGAVSVAWETTSEHSLAGFNLLRRREGTGSEVRINPIWVPALGDSATPAAYQFLDATAEPDVRYLYRIEAVTPEGLSAFSDVAASGPAVPTP